jgi:hypothetical protein
MAYPEDFDDIPIGSRRDLLHHSSAAQIALCIHRLEAEVNNGGFHQFFLNSSGQLVPQTLHALEVIGAPKTRQLLLSAVQIAFPRGYPEGVSNVEAALADYEDVADALEDLDTRFFEYQEPLADLVNEYLSREA